MEFGGTALHHESGPGWGLPPQAPSPPFLQVFADVTPSMRIWKEEIFGPVLSTMTFTNEVGIAEGGMKGWTELVLVLGGTWWYLPRHPALVSWAEQ